MADQKGWMRLVEPYGFDHYEYYSAKQEKCDEYAERELTDGMQAEVQVYDSNWIIRHVCEVCDDDTPNTLLTVSDAKVRCLCETCFNSMYVTIPLKYFETLIQEKKN